MKQYAPKSQVSVSILQVLGCLLFLLGIFLMIGNLTGSFVTFPFAGFITMMVASMLFEKGKQ